ncbi:YqgE/AlgH family protein [Nocardioides fonticola]|uniref:YqgE/AlgH family protein n=1 Tax=Nocardioides fonticola TaxID=450363 RepID=A0ABP7XIX9_9ACTN
MSAFGPGMLLVASPELVDPNFVDTVVLLLDAGTEGALGVVLNRPSPVPVEEILPDWADLATTPEVLFQGGPVGTDGALAVGLLAPDAVPPPGFSALTEGSRLGLVDLDAPVEALAAALVELRIYAGYAGWGAGQLDAELEAMSWYVVPAEFADPFVDPFAAEAADAAGLARAVLRRQPGDLAWHSTRPLDPGLN